LIWRRHRPGPAADAASAQGALLPEDRQAPPGEVTVTVWPKQLHDVCEKHNIHVLK